METTQDIPAVRRPLPELREGITHHFAITTRTRDGEGTEEIGGYVQTGEYENGRLGEIFIRVGKAGDEFAMLDQWAIAFSIALQYGAPVTDLCRKFVGARFWPFGYTRNEKIRQCSSVVDYVTRWVLLKYGPPETPAIQAPADAGHLKADG